MVEKKSALADRLLELTPEGHRKQLLYEAGEILLQLAERKSSTKEKIVGRQKLIIEQNSFRLSLDFLGEGMEWEGSNKTLDEQLKDHTPRVQRIIFRNIVIPVGKKGQSGNPAIRYDYLNGKTTLEFGGIERAYESQILELIQAQIQIAANHFKKSFPVKTESSQPDERPKSLIGQITKHFRPSKFREPANQTG